MEAQPRRLSNRDRQIANNVGSIVGAMNALVEFGAKKIVATTIEATATCHVGEVTDLLSPSLKRIAVIICSDPKCTSLLNPNNAKPERQATMPPQVQKPQKSSPTVTE